MKLADMLGIQPGITALIGGGGKTSLLYHLAEELKTEGTVLLCTTTKIWPPKHIPIIKNTAELEIAFADSPVICAGTPGEQGKLTEPAFCWQEAADYVLVEADGAAGHPAKAHEIWEPVLPDRCHTILVIGASAFNRSIAQAAHRPDRYAALAGVAKERRITPSIAAQIADKEGLHDQVFINQLDELELWKLAEEFAEKSASPVVGGSLRGDKWKRLK